ncbi:MAG: acyltransferase [Solirubrobacteraceae bacterium]|nr:acyltransferase [Solirubrobacteraceae bacterium]
MTRAHGLDGLRGAAALAVVLVHAWMYGGANLPGADRTTVDAVIGELRVSLMLFFVLSGFLVVLPWIRAGLDDRAAPSLRRFASKRAARILPAYWLALVGSYVLLHGTGHRREAELGDLPVFALFGQNYFDETRTLLNPPMWSLAVEVAFYALLPVIGWVLVRAIARGGRPAALAVAGGLAAFGLAWSSAALRLDWPATMTATLPTYLPIFACGIAAAALAHGRTPSWQTRWSLLLGGAALVGWNGWWHHDGTTDVGKVLLDLPAGIGFGMIVAAVAAHGPALLARGPLRWVGIVSYGFYLWHMPVIYVLRLQERWPENPWLAYLSVVAVALTLAVISWFGVERWVAGEGRSKKRTAPQRTGERRPAPSRATA